jgi:hypothetical protein
MESIVAISNGQMTRKNGSVHVSHYGARKQGLQHCENCAGFVASRAGEHDECVRLTACHSNTVPAVPLTVQVRVQIERTTSFLLHSLVETELITQCVFLRRNPPSLFARISIHYFQMWQWSPRDCVKRSLSLVAYEQPAPQLRLCDQLYPNISASTILIVMCKSLSAER